MQSLTALNDKEVRGVKDAYLDITSQIPREMFHWDDGLETLYLVVLISLQSQLIGPPCQWANIPCYIIAPALNKEDICSNIVEKSVTQRIGDYSQWLAPSAQCLAQPKPDLLVSEWSGKQGHLLHTDHPDWATRSLSRNWYWTWRIYG